MVVRFLSLVSACSVSLAVGTLSAPAFAQAQSVSGLAAEQIFEVATNAVAARDTDVAISAFQALAQDPDLEIRNEARFRHGRLLASLKRFADAATLYRAILDEKPDTQRVRIELATMLLLMGKEGEALRTARQAQAGGLPPEVSALVDQFAGALRSMRPYGLSLDLAVAPDTNINRATNADTLDTIIAPLTLSEDAQQQSGVGAKLGSQVWLRLPIGANFRGVARVSGSASLYRQKDFNDISGSGQIGVEWLSGKTLLSPTVGRTYRWYGGDLYAHTDTVTLNLRHPIGKKAQVSVETAAGKAAYRQNALQSGWIYDGTLTYERAFSAKSGGSISLSGQRQNARDPGYATWSGGAGLVYWREIGKMTIFGTANVRHLRADERLFLFLDKRRETWWRLGAGATLRQLQFKGFAPVVRVSREENASTVGIYDFGRTSVELGFTRAF